jgi:adenylate kinase
VRLVLLGPPGAGKGTQAVRIAAKYGIPHIATGDIFRDNVKGGTDLGREAQAYMDRGELVPDDVVNRMVADRLDRGDCGAGFVLDGYPRTVAQAETLEALLVGRGTPLEVVLRFVVDEDELFRRIEGRLEIEGRSDDSTDVLRKRLEEYHDKTAPLEDFYRDRGLVRDVEAVGDVDEVTERALAQLSEVAGT